MTELSFVKMHGAGNDFLMLDGRALPADPGPAAIAALCDRRRGVGGDGLIVLRPEPGRAAGADFRMAYYNSDGLPADMCGNGARCAVAFAHTIGLAGERCRFLTPAGLVRGRLEPGGAGVTLPPPRGLRLQVELKGSDFPEHHFADTGVPHLVIPVPDPAEVDLERWGPRLRRHVALGPAGANVDWIAARPRDGAFAMRTYERGVEAETLACGTGAIACAVVLQALGLAQYPVTLLTRGGDRLRVRPAAGEEGEGMVLSGPAVVSFEGKVRIP